MPSDSLELDLEYRDAMEIIKLALQLARKDPKVVQDCEAEAAALQRLTYALSIAVVYAGAEPGTPAYMAEPRLAVGCRMAQTQIAELIGPLWSLHSVGKLGRS